MKYCRTFRPSRRLEVMGVSRISPEGLDIRPRMPASWRICCLLPRDPESDMTKSGLRWAPSKLIFFISAIMARETSSVTADQMLTTLLNRSRAEMVPSRYSFSISRTRLLGLVHHLGLVLGDDEVVDAQREAGLGGLGEAQVLELVEGLDRHGQAAAQVDVEDQALHALLAEGAVEEGQPLAAGPR